MTRVKTVSIVYRQPNVLLGLKKKKFGVGKYNGFGGGVEQGESLEQSAIRETFEEAGITLINPTRLGMILFKFQTNEQDHLVHFFRTNEYEGIPKESDEITTDWFHESFLPYKQMWSGDKYWLPMLLAGKKFKGNFLFDKDFKIAEYKLEEVTNLD